MVTSNLPKRFEEVQRLNLQFAQREQELHSAHVQECALLQSALVKAEATVTKLTNQLVSHHAEIEQLRNEHKNVASEHSSVSKNLAESIALVDALRSHLEAQQSTIDDTQAEIKLKAIAAASLRDEHESALKTIAERHQAEISGVLAEKQTSLLASDEKVSALAAELRRNELLHRQQLDKECGVRLSERVALENQLVSYHAEIEQLRNEHKNVASEHSSVSKNLTESIALGDALRSHLAGQQSTIDDLQAEINLKAIAAASLRDEHESALKTIAERHQAEISDVLAEKQTALLESDEKVRALAAELKRNELLHRQQLDKERGVRLGERVVFEHQLQEDAIARTELGCKLKVAADEFTAIKQLHAGQSAEYDRRLRSLQKSREDEITLLNRDSDRYVLVAKKKFDSLQVKLTLLERNGDGERLAAHELERELRQDSHELNQKLIEAHRVETSLVSQLQASRQQAELRYGQLIWLARLFDSTVHSFSSVLNIPTAANSLLMLHPQKPIILSINSILAQDGEAFVQCVYLCFLNREPDQDGKTFYCQSLKDGKKKIELIHEIAFSDEAQKLLEVPRDGKSIMAICRALDRLLSLDGEVFVWAIYQSLLGRDPDQDGLLNYLLRLKTGADKFQLLFEVAISSEGQLFQEQFKHSPHVIPLASSLESLLRFEGVRFIRAAFLSILGREPDRDGLKRYSSLLRTQRGKSKILSKLANSEEALSKAFNFGWIEKLHAGSSAISLGSRIVSAIQRRASRTENLTVMLARRHDQQYESLRSTLLNQTNTALENLHLTNLQLQTLQRLGNIAIQAATLERNALHLRANEDSQLFTGPTVDSLVIESASLLATPSLALTSLQSQSFPGKPSDNDAYDWSQTGKTSSEVRKTALESFAGRLKVIR